jgi:hypothetical protein
MRFLLFATASRPALGLTQTLNQWVLEVLSPVIKRPRLKADHSYLFSAEVKNAWSYTSSPPIRLLGVMIKHRELLSNNLSA